MNERSRSSEAAANDESLPAHPYGQGGQRALPGDAGRDGG
jgi:hypothetical protein